MADFTSRLHPARGGGGISFGSNKHGFSTLECPFIPLAIDESFLAYDWQGTPHVVASGQAGETAWEGRLENLSVLDGGIRLTALGYWRAMRDAPYSALWSYTNYADWRQATADEISTFRPAMWTMDNNNRLYFTPINGETYADATNRGAMTYAVPHKGEQNITSFSASYDIDLQTNWKLVVRSHNHDFSGTNLETTVTGTGSQITGTINITLSPAKPRVTVEVFNNTGSNSTITSKTGTEYAKLTAVRVNNTTALSTITADLIVDDLVSHINGINSNQLRADTSLVETTSTDLRDEVYQDEWPADILDRLALLHDYETGVWEERRLHFRPEGDRAQEWQVDLTQIVEVERDLDQLVNSAYATHKNGHDENERTATADNAASQQRADITRRDFVRVDSTSSTEADTHRDTFLADRQDLIIRARIEFSRLYDKYGVEHPLYAVRSGDEITIRNLPPTLSTDIDNIRTFIIGEVEIDMAAQTAVVTPRQPVPSLETLIARREAGL